MDLGITRVVQLYHPDESVASSGLYSCITRVKHKLGAHFFKINRRINQNKSQIGSMLTYGWQVDIGELWNIYNTVKGKLFPFTYPSHF